MRQQIQNLRENYGDTARVVLFDLAAAGVGAFLLWSARNASAAKKAMNAVYGLTLIGIAHKTANYFSTPSVQPADATRDSQSSENTATVNAQAAPETEARNNTNDSNPTEDSCNLVRPATP